MTYTFHTMTTEHKLKSGSMHLVFDEILHTKPDEIEADGIKLTVVKMWHDHAKHETHIVAEVKNGR